MHQEKHTDGRDDRFEIFLAVQRERYQDHQRRIRERNPLVGRPVSDGPARRRSPWAIRTGRRIGARAFGLAACALLLVVLGGGAVRLFFTAGVSSPPTAQETGGSAGTPNSALGPDPIAAVLPAGPDRRRNAVPGPGGPSGQARVFAGRPREIAVGGKEISVTPWTISADGPFGAWTVQLKQPIEHGTLSAKVDASVDCAWSASINGVPQRDSAADAGTLSIPIATGTRAVTVAVTRNQPSGSCVATDLHVVPVDDARRPVNTTEGQTAGPSQTDPPSLPEETPSPSTTPSPTPSPTASSPEDPPAGSPPGEGSPHLVPEPDRPSSGSVTPTASESPENRLAAL
jgi:hypothetical protein